MLVVASGLQQVTENNLIGDRMSSSDDIREDLQLVDVRKGKGDSRFGTQKCAL